MSHRVRATAIAVVFGTAGLLVGAGIGGATTAPQPRVVVVTAVDAAAPLAADCALLFGWPMQVCTVVP